MSSSYPRYEDLSRDSYRADCQWRVFTDPSGELRGAQVLVKVGELWTIISPEDFRSMAERILPQLEA